MLHKSCNVPSKISLKNELVWTFWKLEQSYSESEYSKICNRISVYLTASTRHAFRKCSLYCKTTFIYHTVANHSVFRVYLLDYQQHVILPEATCAIVTVSSRSLLLHSNPCCRVVPTMFLTYGLALTTCSSSNRNCTSRKPIVYFENRKQAQLFFCFFLTQYMYRNINRIKHDLDSIRFVWLL